MDDKLINLVLLKRPPLELPYVLDDTVRSVNSLLQRAGFRTAMSFNVIDPGQINILFGLQMPGTASLVDVRQISSPQNTIIFNTEQLAGESSWITDEYLSLLGDYVSLDYNVGNITKLKAVFGKGARCFEFPLLPDPSFAREHTVPYDSVAIRHDLAFYGSTGLGDRIERLKDIARHGVNLKCFSGAYGANLTPVLMDCAGVLNIHGFQSEVFETIRCLRPAAMGIPILSETSVHSEVASWEHSGVIFIPKDRFAETLADVLRDGRRLLAAGRRLQAFVNDPRWPGVARNTLLAAIAALSA